MSLLVRTVAGIAVVGLCVTPLTGCVPELPTSPLAPAEAVPDLAAIPAEIVVRTNQERQKHGLPGLAASESLTRAAQMHAEQMAAGGRLNHTLPGAPYPTLASRAAAAGYQYSRIAENIAVGYRGAAEVMRGWLNSEGHRNNILHGELTEIGVGVATGADGQIYYASVFGSPR